jgi:hypothetical protein
MMKEHGGLIIIVGMIFSLYCAFGIMAATRSDTIITSHTQTRVDTVKITAFDTLVIQKTYKDTSLLVKIDTLKGKSAIKSVKRIK